LAYPFGGAESSRSNMNKFVHSLFNLNELEQLSRRKQWPNQLHPAIKIAGTLLFIIFVTAIGRFNLGKALLFGVYPILMLSIADIPVRDFTSKLIIPSMISISLGIVNPIIDREPALFIAGFGISGGFISMFTLFIKAMLTISATLLLVSTTSIDDLGIGLTTLKMPKKLVLLLLLMVRYIGILLSEISRTMEAYQLRVSGSKGIHISTWGSLVGQIIIRSYKRSEDIHQAMLLRGYYTGESDT